MSKESRAQKLHGARHEPPSVDEMNSKSVTAEVFSCENLARGRVLLDCGATDTVGSVEAIEAIIDHKKHSKQIMTGCLWILTTYPCTSSVMAHVSKRCPRSEWKCSLEDTWHIYMGMPRKRKECLLSAKSLTALGAVINFETGHATFRNLEPETVVQLERSPTGHLWMNLFEQKPVVFQ